MDIVDVAVAGGGPAGASTALILARAGLRVVLMAPPLTGDRPGDSLAPSVNPLLHRLGLYERFLATGPAPCHGNRSAWGSDGSLAEYDFLRDPHGPGWHIDRPAFDAMLLRAAQDAGTIILAATARAVSRRPSPAAADKATSRRRARPEQDSQPTFRLTMSPAPSPAHRAEAYPAGTLPSHEHANERPTRDITRIDLNPALPSNGARNESPLRCGERDGNEVPSLSARFLVDATGRRAALAHQLGARFAWEQRMLAFVSFLVPDGTPMRDSMTLVETVADGWWYSAPLPDGRLAAAFHTVPHSAAARAARTAAGWEASLAATRHTRARCIRHGYRLTGPPHIAAAGTAMLEPITGDGWLAVGDAAVQHDPLGSHGIAAALESGSRAAAAVIAAFAGDTSVINRYADERRIAYHRFVAARRILYQTEQLSQQSGFWKNRTFHGNI